MHTSTFYADWINKHIDLAAGLMVGVGSFLFVTCIILLLIIIVIYFFKKTPQKSSHESGERIHCDLTFCCALCVCRK